MLTKKAKKIESWFLKDFYFNFLMLNNSKHFLKKFSYLSSTHKHTHTHTHAYMYTNTSRDVVTPLPPPHLLWDSAAPASIPILGVINPFGCPMLWKFIAVGAYFHFLFFPQLGINTKEIKMYITAMSDTWLLYVGTI